MSARKDRTAGPWDPSSRGTGAGVEQGWGGAGLEGGAGGL